MKTYNITDPVAGKLSLEQWLDERIAAYVKLDETRCYNIDETLQVGFYPVGYFGTHSSKRNPISSIHVTDVRPIACTLGLEVEKIIKKFECEYPVELSINYKNVTLFSIHDENVL